jgi:dCTP deaminase
MSIKSDHWIREMSAKNKMIEPYEAGQVRYHGDERVISLRCFELWL